MFGEANKQRIRTVENRKCNETGYWKTISLHKVPSLLNGRFASALINRSLGSGSMIIGRLNQTDGATLHAQPIGV